MEQTAQVVRLKTKKHYKDPIMCPVCHKIFAEWEDVAGKATIKKWCKKCKEFRFITKKA